MANEDIPHDQLLSEIEGLRRKNAFLESQQEALIDGLLIIGPNGLAISSNQRMRKMWAIPDADWNAGDLDTLLENMGKKLGDPDAFIRAFNRLNEQAQEVSSEDIYLLDGRCFECQSVPIAGESGSSAGRMWLFRDVTAHKETEQSLAHKEATLTAMLETAADGIVTADGQGNIISFNGAAEKIFGYLEKDILGQRINILMGDPYAGEHDSYISNYAESGIKKIIGIGRDVTGKRSDGTEFPLHLAVSEVDTPDGRIFMAIIRDITEHTQAMEDRYRSRDHPLYL